MGLLNDAKKALADERDRLEAVEDDRSFSREAKLAQDRVLTVRRLGNVLGHEAVEVKHDESFVDIRCGGMVFTASEKVSTDEPGWGHVKYTAYELVGLSKHGMKTFPIFTTLGAVNLTKWALIELAKVVEANPDVVFDADEVCRFLRV